MRRIGITLLIVSLFSAAPARGDSLPSTVRALLEEYWRTKDQTLLNQVTDTDNVSAYIFDRFVDEQMPQRIPLDELRRDLHLGSFSPTSGSTSVVARSGATDLISAAMESGAVARKTDDKSFTLSFNALPVYQILNGQVPLGCGSLEEDCRQGTGRWIRGLSTSISFNTSNPTTPIPNGTSTGIAGFLSGSNKLLAVSARYELFVRERDSGAAQSKLDEAAKELSTKVAGFLAGESEFESKLGDVLGKFNWTTETRSALKNADSIDRMAEVLLAKYRLAYEMASGAPELRELHDGVIKERLAYITAQNKVLAEKLYRKAFTVDYVHQRPSDEPWLHDLRFVVSTPLGRKPEDARLAESRNLAVPPLTLTLNGGVSFYQHLPAGTSVDGRVRSAQTSLALDWIPSGWGDLRPTYTVAYYFQYMLENGVIQFNREAFTPGGAAIPLSLPAVEILDTKGAIHVGQLRVSIPLGASGVSFPAAVSYSNRTELIPGRPFWQGHFGVSYDLSRLKTFLQSNAMK